MMSNISKLSLIGDSYFRPTRGFRMERYWCDPQLANMRTGMGLQKKFIAPKIGENVSFFPGKGILELKNMVIRRIKDDIGNDHVVVIYLGMNDVRYGQDNVEMIVSCYQDILEEAKKCKNTRIIVIGLIPSPCFVRNNWCQKMCCEHESASRGKMLQVNSKLKGLCRDNAQVSMFVNLGRMFEREVGNEFWVDRQWYDKDDIHLKKNCGEKLTEKLACFLATLRNSY